MSDGKGVARRGADLYAKPAAADALKTTVMERDWLKVVFIRPNLAVSGLEHKLNTADAAFAPAHVERTFHGPSDDAQLWSIRSTPRS